jgi:ABC-type uncharacterized transport system ATPase component
MQLPTLLGRIVKSGEIILSTNEVEALQIHAKKNTIDLDVKDKEFVKLLMKNGAENSSLTKTIAQAKDIAKELKEEGLTITVSYDGSRVITIGSDAHPTFSKIVTRTDNIEINNLRKLLQLGL